MSKSLSAPMFEMGFHGFYLWIVALLGILAVMPVEAQDCGENDVGEGSWPAVGRLDRGREDAAIAPLGDGNMLLIGGFDGSSVLSSTRIFDGITGTFRNGPELTVARRGASATTFGDGRILVVGGQGADGRPVDSSELYDPATGEFGAPENMLTGRYEHTATLFDDGRVWVAGGSALPDGADDAEETATVEAYHPASGWTEQPDMEDARRGHTATRLDDGRVAIIGGRGAGFQQLASIELFDPSTDLWSLGSPIPDGRGEHATVALDDGRLVVFGGLAWQPGDPEPVASARTWISNPDLSSWTEWREMRDPRWRLSARRLADGKILVVGGKGNNTCDQWASVELFDPFTLVGGLPQLTTLAPLPLARYHFAMALLGDGRVLVAGGRNDEPSLLQLPSAYVFSLETGDFVPTGSLIESRKSTDAVLLPNGLVLVAVGRNGDGDLTGSAELFDLVSETFLPTGGVEEARTAATLSVLPDGRAVLVGGKGADGPLKTLDIYDAFHGTFTRHADVLVLGRQDHTTNVLADGSLLVCGGYIGGGAYGDTCERVTFGPGGPSSEIVAERPGLPWFRHSATLLADGRILLVGGSVAQTGSLVDIYDPFLGALTSHTPMQVARYRHGAASLPDGRVLITGGNEGILSAEIYDPATNSWSSVSDMDEGFNGHTSLSLADGSVLIFGDRGAGDPDSRSVFRFDVATGLFVRAGELETPRHDGASVVVADGRVLTLGGNDPLTEGIDTAELYSTFELPPGASVPMLEAPGGILDPLVDWVIPGTGLRAAFDSGDGGRLSAEDRLVLTLRSLSDGRVRRLEVVEVTANSVRVRAPARYPGDGGLFDPPPAGFHLLAPILGGRTGQGVIVEVSCGLAVADPEDQTVELRQEGRFEAIADGGRIYQWQRSDDAGATWQDIEGADAPVYLTPPALGTDHGSLFRAQVDAGCAGITTEPATLSVTDDEDPVVAVNRPAEGEVWLLSPAGGEQNRQVVTWSIQDDLPLASLEVELHWTTFDGSEGSEALCGPNRCDPPAPESREVLFALPTGPPGGVGARYQIRVLAEDVAGNTAEGFSGEFLMVSEDQSRRTLFLTHRGRLEEVFSPAEIEALFASLRQLANHPRVAGLIVDLQQSPGFDAQALMDWRDGPGDPELANRVLFGDGGAHGVVLALLEAYPGVEHLVIVGGDEIVPFARLPDESPILRPSDYRDHQRGEPGSILVAPETVGALEADRYFSDDPLAVLEPLSPEDLNAHSLMLPDLSVGRLVETPEEMSGVIDRFLDRDGVVDLGAGDATMGAGLSGYDFLTDAALRVASILGALLGESSVDASLADGVWSDPAPDPDAARSALLDLLEAPKSLYGLFGHAHHLGLGVPGLDRFDQQALDGLEISGGDLCGNVASGGSSIDWDLAGAVIYGVGCHGGLSVPDSCPVEASYDLPQALLGSGALGYLANSGYGWGLLYGIGYAERLVELFTEQLELGAVELGVAARQAKRQYLLENTRLDPFDVKTLQQWILFGLPMVELRPGSGGDGLGRQEEGQGVPLDHEVSSPDDPDLPPGLTRVSTRIDFSAEGVYRLFDAGGVEQPVGTPCLSPEGCYYVLNGLTTGESDLPVEPFFTYDARLSGARPRGVLWLGGEVSVTPGWVPVIGRLASNEDESIEVLPPNLPLMVMTGPIPTELGSGCAQGEVTPFGGQGGDAARVTVTAGITVYDDFELDSASHHRFDTYELETFYADGPCPGQGPEFGDGPFDGAYHQRDGAGLRFEVPVSDADGVWRVVALWTSSDATAYSPVELERGEDGVFRGQVHHDELSGSNLTYLLQAVDRKGRVSYLPFESLDDPAGAVGTGLPSSGIPLGLPRTVQVDLEAPALPPTLRAVHTVPEWRRLSSGDRLDLALARLDVEISAPANPLADIRLIALESGQDPVCADDPLSWPGQVFAGPTEEILSLRLGGSPPPAGSYRLLLCDVRDVLGGAFTETSLDFELETDHLVWNGGFDIGLDGWSSGGDPAVFFVDQDASQVAGSFSLQLSAGPTSQPSVEQCVGLPDLDGPNAVYRVALHARTAHCEGGLALAGLRLEGFADAACQGATAELGGVELGFSDPGEPGHDHGQWAGADRYLNVAGEWASAGIELWATADRPCELWIDQVSLSPAIGAIFVDGFESGDLGRWSTVP